MRLLLLLIACGAPEGAGDSDDTALSLTDSGGNTSESTDSGTFSADGPVLGVEEVELLDLPQTGPLISFVLSVTDPQDDVNGGTLFVSLSGDAAFEDHFDIAEDVGGDDVLYNNGVLVFGITEIDLDGEYNFELQARDAAGNLGPPLSGDVPPYAG